MSYSDLEKEMKRLYDNIKKTNDRLKLSLKVENRVVVDAKRNRDVVIEIESRKSEMKYKISFRFPVEDKTGDVIDFSSTYHDILDLIRRKITNDNLENIYFMCEKKEYRKRLEEEFSNFRETAKNNSKMVKIIDDFRSGTGSNIIIAEPLNLLTIRMYKEDLGLENLKNMDNYSGNVFISSQSVQNNVFYIYGSFKKVKRIDFKEKEFLLWAFSKNGWSDNISVRKNILLFEYNNIWKPKIKGGEKYGIS